MGWLLHVFVVVLGALATLTGASAVGVQGRDLCSSKDIQVVVKILSALKASPFCSSYLGIKTSSITVPSTATTVSTATVTTTSSVQVLVTATSTIVSTVVDPVTVTNTITITPPVFTVTSFETDTVSTTVTVTSTSTSTICTGGGVMKRDAIPTSSNLQSRNIPNIPNELKIFAEELIKTACGCYVTTPTVTRTVTVTVTSTKTSTSVATSLATSTANTAVVTVTAQVLTTISVGITTTIPVVTAATTATTTSTVTSTTTSILPTTTNISKDYTQVFSGTGCVYNEYTDFYVLAAPNFANAEQQCACNCNKNPSCKSFFIYYSPPSGRFGEEYDCTNDNVPYNSAFTQCNVNFAAQGVAYNKN